MLSAGTYWLGIEASDVTIQYYYAMAASAMRYDDTAGFATGVPATFVVSGTDSRSMSIYADYLAP